MHIHVLADFTTVRFVVYLYVYVYVYCSNSTTKQSTAAIGYYNMYGHNNAANICNRDLWKGITEANHSYIAAMKLAV